MFKEIYDSLLTLTLPQACTLCERSVESFADGIVCSGCWSETRIFDGSETICEKCGRPQGHGDAGDKTYCRRCADHHYDCARAAGIYESGLAQSILRLKREPHLPRRVRSVFIRSFLKTPFQDATKIIAMPLSKRRSIERGFNQAEILARIISKDRGISIDSSSVVRTRHAKKHRSGMDRRGRELSVERSFQVTRPKLVRDEKILLIDDVLASGASASTCAKELKKHGALEVYVFTLARSG